MKLSAGANSQILVMALLADIEVPEHLGDIIAVEGIDLFSSGAQNIAQSMRTFLSDPTLALISVREIFKGHDLGRAVSSPVGEIGESPVPESSLAVLRYHRNCHTMLG